MTALAPPPPAQARAETSDRLEIAWQNARDALLRLQNSQGYWVGELQGDSILESEYLLLKFILHQEHDPDLPKIAKFLRGLQNDEGGWSLFPGGPSDLSATVKAYFALKLMGDGANSPHMKRARRVVLAQGGAERCNSFTKFYFAALGQISYDACPSIPPEIVFLPKWFYFNLYHVSAWTRTMILPLSLLTTLRYTRQLPATMTMMELYVDRSAANRVADPPRGMPRSWRDLFLRVDQLLKAYDHFPIAIPRQRAMKAAEKWLLDRMDGSEGLGAIFPPMVYMLIVLRALGYSDSDPRVVNAHNHLRDFYIEEGDTIRLQPCVSPVWDTGLAMHALAEAGLNPDSDAAQRGIRWLLEKECRVAADWQRNCPPVEPSGWFFEFSNPHYPDVDDTAIVLASLSRLGGETARDALARGTKWLLNMQNDDGGWAAFDRTQHRPLLEKVPFSDHNAMQDPSCPDIVGRVLEGLGHCGIRLRHPAIGPAIAFIKRHQDDCGAWWGRWGVNYIYGTWQVLTGLKSVGENMTQPYIHRAVRWLKSVQKPDGSFGETCQSYDDPSLKGQGESTASQTAWGAMGLLATVGPNDPAVKKAVDWLIEQQSADGNWEEPYFTGTGFPKVFYLKYHLYRLYFPLTALSRYRRMLAAQRAG
ncbi:MAG: squalene--hopene cyclase [Tepidisphaeraceae bacterium]